MSESLIAHKPRIGSNEQLRAVVAAHGMLTNYCPLLIEQKRSTQAKADALLAALDAAISTLQWLDENADDVRSLARELAASKGKKS
jgi:hypothetical protein